MNSKPSKPAVFSLEAMTEVLEHLGYGRHSRNMAYLKALFAHAATDTGYTSDAINPDLLIEAIWNTTDPALLRSRRKNLSTIRSSINRDLAALFNEGKNPEGVTISPNHALVVSQEAKEALYAPFADHFKLSDVPEIEKAGALLEALAEMAEKEGKPLEGSEDLAEKLKRAVKALEKGGPPSFDETEEEEDVEEIPEDEVDEILEEEDDADIDILDEEEELEEIPEDEVDEILEEEDDVDIDILDEEEDLEEDDTELDILDEEDAFEEIPEDEIEEVDEDYEPETDILDDEEPLEEIPEDELEEFDEDDDAEVEELDEEEAFEEIPEDELVEVEEDPDEDLETPEEEDVFEEIPEDEIEEVDEAEEDLDILEDEEAFEEVPEAPPWAADEDPEEMRERAEKFEELLNESERYYNRYIHIPSGRYPAIDPLTGQETEARLDEFLVGKYPITNALFEVFISRTGYKTTAEERGFGAVYEPRMTRKSNGRGLSLSTSKGLRLIRGASWHRPAGFNSSVHTSAHHPVVQVSFEDAMAFAAWSGKRLPTLAQWLAAGGKTATPYPWGDAWESHLCNTEEVGAGGTLPVDAFPRGASPFGVHDLMGNAMEWVADILPEKAGDPVKPAVGGSFLSDRTLTRQDFHIFDTRFSSNILGFRCIGW